MGIQVKTKGLVLHEMPIGDYDKRLVLLTKEYGKITVFSKGARKANSKMLAGSQIFSYGDYMLYKGKNSYNVNQVHLIESFHRLRNTIEGLTYGLYTLEFAEYISSENNPNHELMRLILKTLKILEKNKISYELVKNIFELKGMSFMGYSPWVLNCVTCGSEQELNYFSSREGGVLCNQCSMRDKGAIKISETTHYTMQYILSTQLNELYKFKLTNNILHEFNLVMRQFTQYNLNKKFKTLEFLNAYQ